jgi:hypothetical protein
MSHVEIPTMTVWPEESTSVKTKIAERVYILTYPNLCAPMLVHHCPDQTWFKQMTSRDNYDGPNYWCGGCGYELPEGLAMAVRMNELDL